MHALLPPMLALMLLTALVWALMYFRRLRFIVRAGVEPQSLADDAGQAQLPDHERRAAANFRNLCELPVIFYALCLLLMQAGLADGVQVLLAWLYVAARALHSLRNL